MCGLLRRSSLFRRRRLGELGLDLGQLPVQVGQPPLQGAFQLRQLGRGLAVRLGLVLQSLGPVLQSLIRDGRHYRADLRILDGDVRQASAQRSRIECRAEHRGQRRPRSGFAAKHLADREQQPVPVAGRSGA